MGRAAHAHRERAHRLRSLGKNLSHARIDREYRRLAALFRVEFTSFERKRYVNLSHQSNKAMNLNSYIALLGRRWQEVSHSDGLHLEPALAGCSSIEVPDADFLITLDADSLLVPEYALVLMNEMLSPGNERLAVAQTPYNTIPNPPGLLERIAGATTDIQYLVHQGFTCFDATYWVGANALLRVAALHDIKEVVRERGALDRRQRPCTRVPCLLEGDDVIDVDIARQRPVQSVIGRQPVRTPSRASISSPAAGSSTTTPSV